MSAFVKVIWKVPKPNNANLFTSYEQLMIKAATDHGMDTAVVR